jgi:hypothetical protein
MSVQTEGLSRLNAPSTSGLLVANAPTLIAGDQAEFT